ncbi:hypothetical protein K1T71_014484 [Dendrolimus kikuchii]|uniref:Uncharacterized protein n=1 Tax=Dendrolimus kikuchii TaxID=765133 RepID=A0ACC1CE49_9NEOP|nr:hypothetical protein K1T71_014484 [Dendrolimus kikuchii]
MFCVRCFIFLSIGAAVKIAAEDTILSKVIDTTNITNVCIRPTPGNGTKFNVDGVPYIINNNDIYNSFYITVNCEESYEFVGKKTVQCVNGTYLEPLGECVPNLPTNADDQISNNALCELPEHPKHGSYEYTGNANADIPHMFDSITLIYKCNYGYELKGNHENKCFDGFWSKDTAICKPKYEYLVDPLENGTRRNLTHCIIPDAPKHGSYSLIGEQHPKIPNTYTKVFVDITCNEGYQIHGEESISCTYGRWTAVMPLCGRPCDLKKDRKVDYMCESDNGLVICNDKVRPGEIVLPKCKDNVNRDDLTVMRCNKDGSFDHTETCAEKDIAVACGLITVSDGLILGGFEVQWGEVPWHAGIYSKHFMPYTPICGGTIVTSTAVISAAQCFWNNPEKDVLPHKYAVAVGKIYRLWNDTHDIFAQKSEITEIKIPMMYFGRSANYQSDLAVLKLLTAIEFNRYVRPICLDFNEEINENPLDNGLRKVAGWGLQTEEGQGSSVLKAVFLPIADSKKCIEESKYEFRPFVTADKICAGYNSNGAAVCRGDAGAGLTFSRVEDGVYKHYLQGVVSGRIMRRTGKVTYEVQLINQDKVVQRHRNQLYIFKGERSPQEHRSPVIEWEKEASKAAVVEAGDRSTVEEAEVEVIQNESKVPQSTASPERRVSTSSPQSPEQRPPRVDEPVVEPSSAQPTTLDLRPVESGISRERSRRDRPPVD